LVQELDRILLSTYPEASLRTFNDSYTSQAEGTRYASGPGLRRSLHNPAQVIVQDVLQKTVGPALLGPIRTRDLVQDSPIKQDLASLF